MSVKYFKRIILVLLITAFFAGVSLPCGPDFSIRVLEQGDEYLLETPEGFFYQEYGLVIEELESYLDEINSPNKSLTKYEAKKNFDTEDADVNDLRDAFEEMNITNNIELILDGYEKARKNITELKKAARKWKWEKLYKGDRFDEKLSPRPQLNIPEIPPAAPHPNIKVMYL